MIQSTYYVVIYTTGGVFSAVYRCIFTSHVSAESYAKRSLYYVNKEVYNTIGFDGYLIYNFSINLPF